MADIARIEDRIDRVAVGNMEVSDALGGIRFQNMVEVMEFAKCMAVAETAVPKHLRGNPGMCLAVTIQALEWRFSPFAVANKSYVVNDRIGYESQLVHAVIEQRAPITGRMRHRFEGEGDERRCIVSAVLREGGDPLEYISPPFGKIQPKNSPLWKTKPDLQLYYNTSRDFCRAYFPDVLLGVYAADELRDHVGPDNAKDVSKPDLASRLKGKQGRGFNHNHVERESRGGVIEESTTTKGGANQNHGDLNTNPPAGEIAGQAGETPATDLISEPLGDAAAPDRPAAIGPQPHDAAGQTIEGSSPPPVDDVADGEAEGQPSTEPPPPSLPEGTLILYAAALRRAQKKDSLAKYAKQFWDERDGWEKWKATPDGETAAAVFNVFQNHFGDKDAIERELREIV